MIKFAIFATGEGTNAEAIIKFFNDEPGNKCAQVSLICTNKADAGVCSRADRQGVPYRIITKGWLAGEGAEQLKRDGIEWIILAGFLLKIPQSLILAFPNRIINIHPSLLPEFGGVGMYGTRVHEAVIAAGKTMSGITIHLVDEEYDHGKILFQAACDVIPNDTPQTLSEKIHKLEYHYFPLIIKQTICP